jgi:hypothetical protein
LHSWAAFLCGGHSRIANSASTCLRLTRESLSEALCFGQFGVVFAAENRSKKFPFFHPIRLKCGLDSRRLNRHIRHCNHLSRLQTAARDGSTLTFLSRVFT